MKYLGSISGNGVLISNGSELADATYELEAFVRQKGQLTGTGEINLASDTLAGAYARRDLQLRTADGQVLDLRIADTKMRTPNRLYVDISGKLPSESDWQN